jgi:hypothetical protein
VGCGERCGAVLEYLRQGLQERAAPAGQQERITAWWDLRNRLAHGLTQEVSREQVNEMIVGIRQVLVSQLTTAPALVTSPPEASDALSRIRGKYIFVPTSSEEFIAHKHEELRIEEH